MIEIPAVTYVFPTGATEDDWATAKHFTIQVCWKGPRTATGRGGYSVEHGGNSLSTAGNWYYLPLPFQQRHYRWANYEDAMAAARSQIVNLRDFHGNTWLDYQGNHHG